MAVMPSGGMRDKYKTFSPEEDYRLRQAYIECNNIAEIAQRLGRTKRQVWGRASQLGITLARPGLLEPLPQPLSELPAAPDEPGLRLRSLMARPSWFDEPDIEKRLTAGR